MVEIPRFQAGGEALIPGQETKIPHAARLGQNKYIKMETLLSLVCWTSLIKHPTLGCQCSFVHSTNALEGTHRDDSRDPAFGPGVRRWVRGSDALSGAPVGVGRVASTGANKHSCLLVHRAK